LSAAPPRHQPLLPGTAQEVVPLTVAGGRLIVVVVSVHPESPGEQLSTLLPVEEMLHEMVLPQVPGQLDPQAVGAGLNQLPTEPGQLLEGG
jgi:hypothetical protein